MIVVTGLSILEISEGSVIIDGASAVRPDDVWAHAAAAFERWSDGDAVALDELVGVMTPVLWQVVRAYRLTHEVAEDVVQTTWLALVRSRDRIAEPAAVGGWLTTTARREAWKVAKATGRALPTEDDELGRRLPDESSAEAAVVAQDGEARLWAAVDRLSDRCRPLLRIVAFEHRPDYAKIAADLGMPIGSIGPTRGRCLTKLRALIENEEENE
jgi:RNA polymerase sigma factor (sigma-70 family)